jgi:uncharacterized protein YqjF (DUF2071 family)
MHQSWGKLLFIHWPIDRDLLRPLIPEPLELDLFEDSAWLAIAPFTMWDIRAFPPHVPRLPAYNAMHELNVRTYVHYDGVPGVWFFSLDINSRLAASAARTFYHLPYHYAAIELREQDDRIDYQLTRRSARNAHFQATWTIGSELPISHPGSREFFLTERYCLFAENRGRLYRSQIHHQPWQLRNANLTRLDTTLFEANKLPAPRDQPLLHYAEAISVDIWFLERLR